MGEGCWGECGGLALADVGHEEGNVSLDVCGEFLHVGDKLGVGCDWDRTVDLEVKEVLAIECMVFVANDLPVAESAKTVLLRDV